jgi:phosphate acetyltransferase
MADSVIAGICQRAAEARKTIILPESEDPRVLHAARRITDRHLARIILMGRPEDVRDLAAQEGVSLDGLEIVNPLTDAGRSRYAAMLHQRRKAKGMTQVQADRLLQRTMFYAGFMVADGRADGMVSGSNTPTADTIRAALFSVGLSPGNKTVSACSIMNTLVPEFGVSGSVIFADTGVLPEPNTEQLAEIAILAADACKALLNVEPCVAMLSYSTKGSASGPAVQKVIDATRLARSRRPDLTIDGELQVDAAMIPEVAHRKCRGSPVGGRANTLIFPDLSCGNIACKLVERFGKATALGPLLMGCAKPINDLSRGCSASDIVQIAAITAVQAP